MLLRALRERTQRLAREQGLLSSEFVRRSVEWASGRPEEVAEDLLFSDLEVYDGDASASYSVDHDRHLYGDSW